MTDLNKMADELEANAVELEGFYSSRPDTDTAPRYADTLRQSATALRSAGKMREALECIARVPPITGSGQNQVRRVTLDGCIRLAQDALKTEGE